MRADGVSFTAFGRRVAVELGRPGPIHVASAVARFKKRRQALVVTWDVVAPRESGDGAGAAIADELPPRAEAPIPKADAPATKAEAPSPKAEAPDSNADALGGTAEPGRAAFAPAPRAVRGGSDVVAWPLAGMVAWALRELEAREVPAPG